MLSPDERPNIIVARFMCHCTSLLPLLLLLVCGVVVDSSNPSNTVRNNHNKNDIHIVVIGSVNADTFLSVQRLPVEGENLALLPGSYPVVDIPGGKGCTQAVAVAKLLWTSSSSSQSRLVRFVGQFGHDPVANLLEGTLRGANVDCQYCNYHPDLPSGRGYVFITQSGQVSAVVSGGSNQYGWTEWELAWTRYNNNNNQRTKSDDNDDEANRIDMIERILHNDDNTMTCRCIMLQREVPEYVNLLIATYCKRWYPSILIVQDVGGEDRPIRPEMLQQCDYLIPNESELRRLVVQSAAASCVLPDSTTAGGGGDDDNVSNNGGGDNVSNNGGGGSSVVDLAKALQRQGARNVLVTQGSQGSTLVTEAGDVLYQPALAVSSVLDETGAGDCYRAAFVVALLENKPLQQCMMFASAAGACSVERHGAVPSTPSRHEVDQRLLLVGPTGQPDITTAQQDSVLKIPRGDGFDDEIHRGGGSGLSTRGDDDAFPFLIGSRLNSMKDRPDLWDRPLDGPRDYVQRQAMARGLTCVDFNYPQHFHDWSSTEAKTALDEAGLVAGAVCLRYPPKFARGAMNHPDSALRREAIELTKEAARVAVDLGCKEVVVWSAFDGYDYPFQVDYDQKWKELVDAFQECCDAFPDLKISLEYKPTDENTRFFTVPSTGAALLLVHEVNRANFGLTLDVGHMLMAGENPAQSIAMVGRMGKLFGIQLNDGYTRLAAEDGLMFGSVHPGMALEIMYQLLRIRFDGHLYFDTFPQRTDPVQEVEYNIRRVQALWKAARSINEDRLKAITESHDALGAIGIIDEAMRMI